MLTATLFPGRYLQGDGAFSRLGSELARFGEKGLAILAPAAERSLREALAGQSADLRLETERFNRECSEPEIDRLCGKARQSGTAFIVGIGGGKTIDTAKVVDALLTADGEGRRRKGCLAGR